MKKMLRHITCLVTSLALVMCTLLSSIASAQGISQDASSSTSGGVSAELDVLAPVIELSPEQVEQGVAGEAQVFRASITDDNVISTVILYHRFAGDPAFSSTEMLRTGAENDYEATVVTTSGDSRSIQYYIEAADVAGNRSVLGFPFDPLQLPIAEPVAQAQPAEQGLGREKLLWGVAGLLLLALVIGAVGSSDSSDSTPQTGDPLVIEITETQ